MKIKLICLFTIIFWAINSIAQLYNFKTYSVPDGLSQSQVYSINQDSKKNMWFGTFYGGVTIYNGINSFYINKNNYLKNQVVLDIERSDDNTIYIATKQGLYQHSKNKTIQIGNQFDKEIWDIAIDKKNNIWIATSAGLWYYDKNRLLRMESDSLINWVSPIFIDSKGIVWFFSIDKGLVYYKNKNFYYHQYPEFKDIEIFTFYEDSKNNIWISTSKGLYIIKNEKLKKIEFINKYTNKEILSITEYPKGRFWYGTNGDGIIIKDKNNVFSINENQGLGYGRITKFFVDIDSNLWIGTNGNGVKLFQGFEFIHYPLQQKTTSKKVAMSVDIDKNNLKWIGTDGNGLIYFNDSIYGKITTKEGLSSNHINAIYVDSINAIWIGTENDLNYYNPKTKKIKNFSIKNSMVIYESVENIWIGTLEDGAYTINKQSHIVKKIDYIPFTTVWNISKSNNGEMIFCTDIGVLFHKNNKITTLTTQNGLPDNNVGSILELNNGHFWIGTDGGLAYYNGDTCILKTLQNLDNISLIYLMQKDFNNNIWLGTEKGLVKLQINQNQEITNDYLYSKQNGFTSIECNSNASTIDNDGNLWFGTINGITKYQPSENISVPENINVNITQVDLFYQKIDWSKYCDSIIQKTNLPYNPVLKNNNNHLTFYFNGYNYQNPQEIHYQFMLKGQDKIWSPPTQKNQTTYTNLPPGEYTFCVKAGKNNAFSTQYTSFSFVIKKPFWQKWWFYLLLITFSFTVTMIFLKIRTRKLLKTKQQLEKKVSERTIEINKQKNEIKNKNDKLEKKQLLLKMAINSIENKKSMLENKNKEILSSIRYAQRIQKALLSPEKSLQNLFSDAFIWLQPKDYVSGDFYWFSKINHKETIVAAVDCTGHGVPGALMAMIGNDSLSHIVKEHKQTIPALILEELDIRIKQLLKQDIDLNKNNDTTDGMDIAICNFNIEDQYLQFSGAYRPLYIIRNNQLINLYASKHAIGGKKTHSNNLFTNHITNLYKNDIVYLFSDGFADQFGGIKNKKYLTKRFRQLLLDIHHLPLNDQKEILKNTFLRWKNKNEQVDDILIIGLKI